MRSFSIETSSLGVGWSLEDAGLGHGISLFGCLFVFGVEEKLKGRYQPFIDGLEKYLSISDGESDADVLIARCRLDRGT